MKKFSILCFAILLMFELNAQLAVKEITIEDGATGYMVTHKKKPIDDIVYADAMFQNGFMIVTRDENGVSKYGVYAPDGKLIIEPKQGPLELMFLKDKPIFFLFSRLSPNGEYQVGLFDLQGKIVCEPMYQEISLVEDYFQDKPYTYIQLLKKNDAGETCKGVANLEGKMIVQPRYKEIEWTSFEGFESKKFYLATDNELNYLFDSNGRLIMGKGFLEIGEFCGGKKLVAVKQKTVNDNGEDQYAYGFYDMNADKEVFACIFDGWQSSGNDEVIVEKGEFKGLINPGGYLLEPSFESIELISDSGIYMCKTKDATDHQIFLSRSKKLLDERCAYATENWPLLVLEMLKTNEEDVTESILYNLETNQLLNEKYDEYVFREFASTTVRKNSKWYVMSADGGMGKEIPGTWNDCAFVSDKLLKVQTNNLYGLMKSDGKVVLSPQYEEMSGGENGVYVKLNGKYGMIDYNGSVIIPCNYENAFRFYSGKAQINDGSGTYYINKKNVRVEN